MHRACLGRPSLTDEQRTAVLRLTSEGDGIVVVIGVAGAGKTFALRTCADSLASFRHAGLRRRRRAPRGPRARDRCGNPELEHQRPAHPAQRPAIADGHVLVIDDAGTAGTRALAALAEAVDTADGKLVLVAKWAK